MHPRERFVYDRKTAGSLRVSSRAGPVLQHRLERRQLLKRHPVPHTLVVLDHMRRLLLGLLIDLPRLHRHDLLIEDAVPLRLARPPLALDPKLVLLLPADPVPLRNVLRRLQHGHEAVPGVLDGRLLQQRGHIHGDAPGAVVAAHALDAPGQTDVDLAGQDGVRDVRDGLQAAGALPVDGVEGGRVGEAGRVERHAACLCEAQLRQHVPDHGVVDVAGLDVGSLHGGLHHLYNL